MGELSGIAATKTRASGDVVRYSAIEVVEGNNLSATIHSDTYSFTMLILECITEEIPFSNLPRDPAVVHARITKRMHPPRPDGQDPRNHISDDLWRLMMECWSNEPDQRPTMKRVLSFLHQLDSVQSP